MASIKETRLEQLRQDLSSVKTALSIAELTGEDSVTVGDLEDRVHDLRKQIQDLENSNG